MNIFERKLGPKRNLEQDKKSFLEAVSTIEIQEIVTEFDELATHKLTTSIKDTKLFILGEKHGVKETPDIIYTLFKKFGFRQLALEWEPKLKVVVERFLESGELDFNAIKDSPDGSITAGHFALIKKLKAEGMLERVVCFNESSRGRGWNAGDVNMARNILANLSDAPMLAVAGYLHTRTESFDDEHKTHHPMGENVKKKIPDVPSGRIEYQSGKYHNYGTNEFETAATANKLTNAKFILSEGGLYHFELPEAHVAIVPDPGERL